MADSRTHIDKKANPVNIEPKQNCAVQSAAELRKEKIRLRRSLTEEQRGQKNAEIAEQLILSEVWQNAQNVLIYVSYGAEVSTSELIDRALLEGKRVFCPKVEKKGMEFYRIFSLEDLKPGFRGIPEPEGRSLAFERHKADDWQAESREARRQDDAGNGSGKYPDTLLIAPGTVFDRTGHRIGYGGGYYDRYLGQFSVEHRPYCIGLCFSCQLAERILPKTHDVRMDRVIFDKTPRSDG